MITDKDISKLKQVFATKDDLKKVSEDIVQFKDDILTEIVKLRDDITVVVGYRDMIEDHEARISKLEIKPSFSP